MAYAPYPPVHDPYRARSEGSGVAPLSSSARVLFTVLAVLCTLSFASVIATWTAAVVFAANEYGAPDEAWGIAAGIILVVTCLLIYALSFAGVFWVYRAWSWLPQDQRYANNWRSWISPAQGALFLLIPYFQYYWMFMINLGLCDALDRMRASVPTRQTSPRGLALAACICQIFMPIPVGMILWIVYMMKIERMTAEMSRAMTPRRMV